MSELIAKDLRAVGKYANLTTGAARVCENAADQVETLNRLFTQEARSRQFYEAALNEAYSKIMQGDSLVEVQNLLYDAIYNGQLRETDNGHDQ